MEVKYKTVVKNNFTNSQLNSMQNIDELMFEDSAYKSLGISVPSCAILAYLDKPQSEDLIGKVNINTNSNSYGNQKVTRAQIGNLAVLPYMQHRGIGGKLIEKSLKICKLNNIDYAYLSIDLNSKSYKNLIKFYSKYGFIPTVSQDLQSSKKITMIYPVSEKLSNYNIESDLIKSVKTKK